MATERDIERFWSKVEKTEACWIWHGTRNSKGYGRFDLNRRRIMAHRISYEITVGAIPKGLQIDHLCRNTSCVRPDHLQPVTAHVNILRSDAPSAINARRSECKHGHTLSADNLYVTPDGRRQCRTCIAARNAAHAAQKRTQKRTQGGGPPAAA